MTNQLWVSAEKKCKMKVSNKLYCEASEIKLLVDMVEEAGILFYSLLLKLTEEGGAKMAEE